MCVCAVMYNVCDDFGPPFSPQYHDEELGYIPQQFAPLSNIRRDRLPKHCLYEQSQKVFILLYSTLLKSLLFPFILECTIPYLCKQQVHFTLNVCYFNSFATSVPLTLHLLSTLFPSPSVCYQQGEGHTEQGRASYLHISSTFHHIIQSAED